MPCIFVDVICLIMLWVAGHWVSIAKQIYSSKELFSASKWNYFDIATQLTWMATFICWACALHNKLNISKVRCCCCP